MNERIQQALDGEFPVDQLAPEERAELQRYRAAICTALEPMRQMASIDVTPEVMARVGPGPFRRALDAVTDWLWSPRALSLSVRPAFALAGMLAAVALVSVFLSRSSPIAAPAPERVIVQFRLGAAAAREVALVGDFNGWRPEHRLHQLAAGVWAVDLALEPGVYNYVFVIDGVTLRLDPLAPQVTDGFGGASSRVAVLGPAVKS